MSDYASDFHEQFMDFIEKVKILPNEILFQHDEVLKLVEPIASRLGINLTRVKRLPALEKARVGLFSFFNDR